MDKSSEIIRTEIIRVLNENGKSRGTELVNRVIKKVGNKKTVYREISALVESGDIEKTIHDKSNIEYDLVNLDESANNLLKNIHKEIEIVAKEISKFSSSKNDLLFHERLNTVIYFIHAVQSIEGVMKLLSFYPVFRKNRMFSLINKKVDSYWHVMMDIISHQKEEEFLNDVLANLRMNQLDSENLN